MLLYAGFALLLTTLFAAGLVWARRGKRIDRHPICRRCGYDLHGIDLEARPDCPECGVQIISPKDLRQGNRKLRRSPAYAFGLLALLCLIGTIAFTSLWAKDYDWNRVKPVSWLINEASDPTQPNRMDAALSELDRRFDRELLSNHKTTKLVDAGLDYQADTTKIWDDR